MAKPKHKRPSIENLLAINIGNTVRSAYVSNLWTINNSIISLFWEIGELINERAVNNPEIDFNYLLESVTRHFSERYGDDFSIENLLRMTQFSKDYPFAKVEQISLDISWNKITEIARLGNSLHDLPLIKNYNSDPIVLKLVFEGDNAHRFIRLYTPQDRELKIAHSCSDQEVQTILSIEDKIVSFQKFYNNFLNMRFSHMFWHIGNEIIRVLSLFSDSESYYYSESHSYSESQAKTFLAESLNGQYGNIFDEEELEAAITFYRQHPDIGGIHELISSANWDYIKILSATEDQGRQLELARRCLNEGLSPEQLKAVLTLNGGLEPIPQQVISEENSDQLNKSSETIHTEGNYTVTVRFNEVPDSEFTEHDLNRNIFKTESLIKFMEGS